MTATAVSPNTADSIQKQVVAGHVTWGITLGMLASRLALFGLFQAAVALVLFLSGQPAAWEGAVSWWPVAAILANCTLFWLLAVLYRREGSSWRAPLRFERGTVGGDLLSLVGFGIIMAPLSMMPANLLADWLLGGSDRAFGLFFHALPPWAALVSLVGFPVSIALTELPIYCGYVQPRLESLSGRGWLAWLLAALFLAGQHMTLPLILDGRFILWRLLMFLPFALAVTLLLRWRPRLLPYMLIFHGLLDLGTIWFVFAKSFGI